MATWTKEEEAFMGNGNAYYWRRVQHVIDALPVSRCIFVRGSRGFTFRIAVVFSCLAVGAGLADSGVTNATGRVKVSNIRAEKWYCKPVSGILSLSAKDNYAF